jgi:hypothetical protein
MQPFSMNSADGESASCRVVVPHVSGSTCRQAALIAAHALHASRLQLQNSLLKRRGAITSSICLAAAQRPTPKQQLTEEKAIRLPATTRRPQNMSSSRVQFIRQVSLPTRDSKAPPLDARWLHKGRLDSEASSKKAKWIAFADADNEDIEAAWRAWRVSQAYRDSSTKEEAGEAGEAEQDKGAEGKQDEGELAASKHDGADEAKEAGNAAPKVKPSPRPVWDPSEPIPNHICPVGEDHLWEADFQEMRVFPAFWPGVSVELLRTTWFYDGSILNPVPPDVSEELEKHYQRLQPFGSTYSQELAMALKLGAEAEQKISCKLDETKPGSHVIFLGPYLARIYGQNLG